jgi:glycosyltransferase involved in cell wall biosynthesis
MSSTQTPGKVSPERIAELLTPVPLDPLSESPLVSVLTGNYNYAPFLGEAIESVLAQTYTNFEMIVCDDGSVDNSCEVAENYAQRDSRVRLIRQQNGGQASAWNTAYRECRGEIICFLDADDRYLPEKLEVVVRAFQSKPDSGFVGHRVYRTNAIGRRDDIFPLTTDPPSGWYGPFVVRTGASPRAMAFGSAMCLRRKVGDLIFPLPDKFRICADTVVIALSPLMTVLTGIASPLAEYRYHGQNGWDSRRVSTDSMDQLEEVERKMWEVSSRYLETVDPVLLEAFPPFHECPGNLLGVYMRARLKSWAGAVSAYRDLVGSETFLTVPTLWRWFWRFSIFLPRAPLFYAISSNQPKQLLRKAVQSTRAFFASRKSVGELRNPGN